TSKSERRNLPGVDTASSGTTNGGATAPVTGSAASSQAAPVLRRPAMPSWRPDPTFYPSPRSAMRAPVETLAYVARVNPTGDGRPDAIAVVDVDPTSGSYGETVGEVAMTHSGDELHHFGWNACSS